MKRLFIGIDGTSQAAFYDTFHSNVYRLNLALAFRDGKDNPQIFVYLSGVGASSYRYFGLGGKMFGQGIDEIILQAYVNLVSNYEQGDKVYIFGFSRGAVAGRALSGLISKSGLVKYSSSSMIEHAWRHFVGTTKPDLDYSALKHDITHAVDVEFLGVWDTVYGFNTQNALRKSPFMRLRFQNFGLDRRAK